MKPSRRLSTRLHHTNLQRGGLDDAWATEAAHHRQRAADVKGAALVAWIDEHEEARAREKCREQGRAEVVRSLLLGELRIRDVVTGGWFEIPSPWTDGDVERWGVTRESLAETVAPAAGRPPQDYAPLAHFARLNAIKEL